MGELLSGVAGVVWDWGDTLMRDIPGQAGPMVEWPRVEAMPGAAAALRAFSAVPLQCVATNAEASDEHAVAAALERVGLRKYLARFFTSRQLGARKPDPEFFRRVAAEVGIAPTRLLAVGNDLVKDVLPAAAAGLGTVWVAGASHEPPPDTVDLVVPDLDALAGLVERSLLTENPSTDG